MKTRAVHEQCITVYNKDVDIQCSKPSSSFNVKGLENQGETISPKQGS
jgi:hypothetical protein